MRRRTCRLFKETYCARILIEGARFPPFGFDTAEISSNSNEDTSFGQKDLLCPDSDRGRSVPPLRVRHSGDKLEFKRDNDFINLWGCFGVALGSLWGHFGVTLGPVWDHFWHIKVSWGAFRCHFGVTLSI